MRVLIYLFRRDLRISDNPILHEIGRQYTQSQASFTHLLPLYIIHPGQLEVSGFLLDGKQSPFPEAKSRLGGFWRTGPYRAKFLAESLWDVKRSLQALGSDLLIRTGRCEDVLNGIRKRVKETGGEVIGLWMVGEPQGTEEVAEEYYVCRGMDGNVTKWADESVLIHHDDLKHSITETSDVFTSFRKTVEPLRTNVRDCVSAPRKIPPFPWQAVPDQEGPFSIPGDLDTFTNLLLFPLLNQPTRFESRLCNVPHLPSDVMEPNQLMMIGGETAAQARLHYYVSSGAATTYKVTRNGLIGSDYSTKFSAYLALGSLTARQIHKALYDLEEGTDSSFTAALGFGQGENAGTTAIRFELLWRDYMRLCAIKYGAHLFALNGFASSKDSPTKYQREDWRSLKVAEGLFARWASGTTGLPLIDASMRELYLTGYTSNRARQNVASFLAKHLKLDWRLGAEWMECLLIDHDVSSNWGNWQYNSGVGNDPRGSNRVFNAVKQSKDYDANGEYVKKWVSSLRMLTSKGEEVGWSQPWKLDEAAKRKIRQAETGDDEKWVQWLDDPIKRLEWVGRGSNGQQAQNGHRNAGQSSSRRGGKARKDKRRESSQMENAF